MLNSFQNMGYNINVKMHFLHSHLEYFPENLVSLSGGQEEKYQGRWKANMTAVLLDAEERLY